MKFDLISPIDKSKYNSSFNYRLKYDDNLGMYLLTKRKYKILFKSYSLRRVIEYIEEKNIFFDEVHLPYITLRDLLKDYVTF